MKTIKTSCQVITDILPLSITCNRIMTDAMKNFLNQNGVHKYELFGPTGIVVSDTEIGYVKTYIDEEDGMESVVFVIDTENNNSYCEYGGLNMFSLLKTADLEIWIVISEYLGCSNLLDNATNILKNSIAAQSNNKYSYDEIAKKFYDNYTNNLVPLYSIIQPMVRSMFNF